MGHSAVRGACSQCTRLLVFIFTMYTLLHHGEGQEYCCQTSGTPSHCSSNSSCIVKNLDGSVGSSEMCSVTQDDKFENTLNRSDEAIFDCMRANWDSKETFDEGDQLPFYFEMFPVVKNGVKY